MKCSIGGRSCRHWATVFFVILFSIGVIIKAGETILDSFLGWEEGSSYGLGTVIYDSGAFGLAIMAIIGLVFHKNLDK